MCRRFLKVERNVRERERERRKEYVRRKNGSD
jgi:hypothetical protein